MGLYDIKKSIESVYYQYCLKEGRLPLPDTVYYLWDKKKITNSLLDRGTDMQNKERSPRKEKKKKKKPK